MQSKKTKQLAHLFTSPVIVVPAGHLYLLSLTHEFILFPVFHNRLYVYKQIKHIYCFQITFTPQICLYCTSSDKNKTRAYVIKISYVNVFCFALHRLYLLIVYHSLFGQQHINCLLLQSSKYLQTNKIHQYNQSLLHCHILHTCTVVECEGPRNKNTNYKKRLKSKAYVLESPIFTTFLKDNCPTPGD